MNLRNNKSPAATAILVLLGIPLCLTGQSVSDAQITILQTTDLHHHANGSAHVGLDVDPVNGTGSTGAYSRISAYVKDVRSRTNHPVVLVDSGDWTMGTLYDLTLGSRPLALMFLDLMKYDCVTLGNHEFDYAPKGLAQMLGTAQTAFGFKTPIVATNMNLGGSADLAPYVGDGKAIQPVRIQDLANGIRIAYIGLMGQNAAFDAPAASPVSFTDFSHDYASIQKLVDGLRQTQAVQVVIVLSHSGTDASGTSGEDVDLATNVRGIDVIASGHTHTLLTSARAVKNGPWTTQIIDAGAFGANVARIDLTYHAATNSTTADTSTSTAMSDANLAAIQPNLVADAAITAIVSAADQQLNTTLSAFFTQAFPDYERTSLAKGIYHPVGTTEQNMQSNGADPVPSPNGLGDLAADSIRSTANGIISKTLTAVGGDPSKLPSYDFTPFQVSLIPTGVLRGNLQTGVPLNFTDFYNLLPLGITPDSTQALPLGYPMISAYMELVDLKMICALQLVAQSNLAPADYYLNLSGLKYGLKPAESYAYFKYATAAAVLQLTSQKARAGSVPALQALGAITTLAQDNGGALLAAYGNNNPFAGALVKLNDSNPTFGQILANLSAVGQIAGAAVADATTGSNRVSAVVVSKAVAAIDRVEGFAPADGSNTGVATDLSSASRVRLATDLFAILALESVQKQFGVNLTAYKSAIGPATLAGTDLAGLLSNRINANPAGAGLQELKEWMAMLTYLQSDLKGTISSAYASTSDFTQFGKAGAAVQTRNASYPLASIGQFTGTLSSLLGHPPCASIGKPVISVVTNTSYGSSLSATGTVIVWGSGFSPGGGNTVRLTQPGPANSIKLDVTSGTLFWDLSANQLNAALPGGLAAGKWLLAVMNSCGVASDDFEVTLQ